MSTTGQKAFVQMFAKIIDSFVDRCLRQVIPDLLLPEAFHPTHMVVKWVEVL